MRIVEPHINLVTSVEYRNYRVRAVGRQIYFRPLTETFHEFLWFVLQLTFGEDWWREQKELSEAKKHVVINWFAAVTAWLATQKTGQNQIKDGLWSVQISGYAQSLMQLGFDVLCLQQVDRLPNSMIERLRDHDQFQGVRYEIGVAAIFARAGFSIEFCESVHGEKICEFIAVHPSGLRIAVEAKSRHRPGVLNRKGHQSGEFRADLKKIYAKARKKKPELPFVIFLDANLPPSPEIPWEKSPWLQQLKGMFDEFPEPTPERPDPHNLVVVTNYGFYYNGNNPSKMLPALYISSLHPKYPFSHPDAWHAIQASVERYTVVPIQL
jgi:hypothetical protein